MGEPRSEWGGRGCERTCSPTGLFVLGLTGLRSKVPECEELHRGGRRAKRRIVRQGGQMGLSAKRRGRLGQGAMCRYARSSIEIIAERRKILAVLASVPFG